MSWRTLSWMVLALLACAGLYGFLREHLWAQQMWSDAGRARFLAYAAVFWSASATILWLRPGLLVWIAVAAVLFYAAWWSGPLAPLAVLYFAGSSLCLGRRIARDADAPTATLLGSAVWMLLIWLALHFPINTRGIYAGALLIPYIFGYRSIAVAARTIRKPERKEAAALAVLLFILIAHFLAALKPEVSADGLSMHLALPMAVARDARWAFDFRLNNWALMPNGADSLYASAYLLGGEAGGESAAHLLNFAFLVLICVLLARAARRWVSPSQSWLIAALFASTPLVQLVTGSLFVENVWGAMILASTLATVGYLETNRKSHLLLTAVFLGAAVAMKLQAGAFAVPILATVALAGLRKREWRTLAVAGALLIAFGAPPYAYAFARTGNPVFPFVNRVFRSPDFDTEKSFSDPRFTAALSWKTPYEVTFRSREFMEAQGGASGFQYFLLLLPAVLLTRRKEQWAILAIAGIAAAIILGVLPNLRYLYPALPLFSLAAAWLASEAPAIAATAGLLSLIVLNLWFLPSSGWYNNDFALFRRSDIRPYVERMAPVRPLIAELNRLAPGEPAAFFSTDQTGELNAPAYTDGWHSERYWSRVRSARTPRDIASILDHLGVHYVIAPNSRKSNPPPVEMFLRLWLQPVSAPIGPLGLFQMRDVSAPPDDSPFAPGRRYDDLEERINYSGAWLHDLQFPESSGQSITYSEVSGDSFRLAFTGSAVTYVFTRAANRGIAEIRIDGRLETMVDQYAPQTVWQSTHRIQVSAGEHTLEVRVSGKKDPRSAGVFVDLDAVEVEP